MKRMTRLLIVSYWYPPFQAIGAERIGSFCRHLPDRGWDIEVISVVDSPWAFCGPRTDENFNGVSIFRLPGFSWAEAVKQCSRGRIAGATAQSSGAADAGPGWKRRLFSIYNDHLCFPDACWPWVRLGRRRAVAHAIQFQPDMILSSAMPFSSHVMAHHIQAKIGCPWIADYRDYWTGHAFRQRSTKNEERSQKYEQRIMGPCDAVISVSEPYAKSIGNALNKKGHVVFNGYEPLPERMAPAKAPGSEFKITYTGMIYGDLQDPDTFFDGYSRFINENEDAQGHVVFHYCGPNSKRVEALALQYRVDDHCRIDGMVAKDAAREIQAGSDLLLFLSFRIHGWLSGKLMEYLGSCNPVLSVGPEEPSSAGLLQKYSKGKSCSTAAEVAEQLSFYHRRKTEKSSDSYAPCPAFTRQKQAERLDSILREYL